MDLSRTIEQLSFGRSLPKLQSCLGLYISPDAMFLSEVRVDGRRPSVEHLLRIPVPSPAYKQDTQTRGTGSLNTELLADPDKLAAPLKQAMEKVSWGSRSLMVTLSHHFGLLRYFIMPRVDRRFWKTVVTTEAKKYIPIPFAELAYNFQVFPASAGTDKRPRQAALFGVTHQNNLLGVRALAQRLGLSFLGLELAPCSVERLWDALDAEQGSPPPYGYAFVEEGVVRMLLSENGVPLFFREMPLADDSGKQDLRRVDLLGSVDFARKQFGAQRPAEIRLEGPEPEIAEWRDALAQETSIPVAIRETAKQLRLKSGQWGGYASVGCAMSGLDPGVVSLVLGQAGAVSDEERRVVRFLFAFTGILCLLMGVTGLFRQGLAMVESRRLGKIQQQMTVDAFRGKTAAQIELMVDEMRKRLDSYAAFTGSSRSATRVMEAVAEAIPDPLWITSLTYGNSVMSATEGAQTVALSGHVAGPTPMVEQDLAIRFRQNLQDHPWFGKLFRCGGVSVQTEPGASADPRAAEGRTTFTVECSHQGI